MDTMIASTEIAENELVIVRFMTAAFYHVGLKPYSELSRR